MTSADFCLITIQVTLIGAMKPLLQMLPIVCISSLSTTASDAWILVSRCDPSRDLLQKLLNACKADLPG
jgi:hypothetical protein